MSADATAEAPDIAPHTGPQGRTPQSAPETTWEPEFDGQRPPFEPGNSAAVKSGAHSQRKVEEIARKVSDELLERFPVVAEYPETLTALARVEGITRLLFSDIVTNGAYDKKGQFRTSLLERYFTAENTGAKLRSSLGMTPQSEAQVARDRAVAASNTVDVLGELMKQGRATKAQSAPLPADRVVLDSEPNAPGS
ncbi:hypothetical protein [Antiquaquibacter soli]|uniref:Uncharacterized protein n=1 Tax=Antiquaquibacter soli TaxID=3064523 RepID=A0ABT9BMZ0_9MICO|nr:hypothetical protein [Protaetiibacter sp. WY-16]MDO7881782.1 hypothetical protein [Protaetiibacter sp. WY-16]